MYRKMRSISSYNDLPIGCQLLIVCSLLFLCCFVTVAWMWTEPRQVMVESKTWLYEQQIEDFQERTEQSWDDYVPFDAYNSSCYRRSRSESCRTNDDGTRSCTTNYDNWCTYTVQRWGYLTSYTTQGHQNDRISVPEPTVRCNGVEEVGCQRYGALIGTFTVNFVDTNNNPISCRYPREQWELMQIEHWYEMVFGRVFNEARCEIIQQETTQIP